MLGLGLLQLSADKYAQLLDDVPNGTILDTARAYGNSEQLLGDYLKANEDFHPFVVTKVGINFDPANPFMTPDQISSVIDDSVEKLQRIDCILLHRINPRLSHKSILKLYDRLVTAKRDGKCRYIGVSECNASILERLAQDRDVDFFELAYSPFIKRADQNGVMDVLQRRNIRMLSYSVAMKGLLSSSILNVRLNAPTQMRKYIQKRFNLSDFDMSTGWLDPRYIMRNVEILQEFVKYAQQLDIHPVVLSEKYVIMKGLIPIMGITKPESVESRLTVDMSFFDTSTIDRITTGFKGDPNPSMISFLDDDSLNVY